MISKLLVSLVFVAFIAVIGGFVAFAVWDVPVEQKTVEQTVDNGRFLEKSP